jgi:NADH:ubiquinone oxidoreductase subunit 3 (subunit A)
MLDFLFEAVIAGLPNWLQWLLAMLFAAILTALFIYLWGEGRLAW